MTLTNINELFKSPPGESVYTDFLRAVSDFNLSQKLAGGVLIGFSGGSDSVMLLCAINKYCTEHGGKICAVHVNHMIRGEEALRDEAFSRKFCEDLGIEFHSFRRDVPAYAKENSLGIEEAARNVRYSIFADILQGRNDLSCIAVAHNATDNLETVIFNMMRGAGARGIAGINPTRDDIIRPLLYVPKRDIQSALDDAGIAYVTDSTNFETEYTRNYIRAEILPKLKHISPNPEGAVTRLSRALREDSEYLENEAEKVLSSYADNCLPREALAALPKPIFYRAISIMAKKMGITVENTHLVTIYSLLLGDSGDFSVSLPGKNDFLCKSGKCQIAKKIPHTDVAYEYKLSMGVNHIDEIGVEIILSDTPIDDFSSKVYKFSIQQAIDFDIINGGLFVREKRDGDSYFYGGMTHKLKKMFNDKKISPENRKRIPIFCDESGILWVPGFSVRGTKGASHKKLYVAVAFKA